MNKMESALRELNEMDDLAAQDSPIHRLSPLSKLITTVVYIVVAVSFHKYQFSGLVVMALIPVLLYQISGIEVRTCFYKLRVVLPLVMAVGLFNPIFDRAPMFYIGSVAISGGTVSMLSLMLKGVLCLMMSFLLIATTQIDNLCAALRRLHVPGMLVTLLLLTFRYVGVMTEELAIMSDAYKLRAPGQKGVHFSAWGSFLGQALLRSMDRASELWSSMQLRGFNGAFHYAAAAPFGARDALYTLGVTAASLLLRYINLAELIGRMVMR